MTSAGISQAEAECNYLPSIIYGNCYEFIKRDLSFKE